MRKCEAVFRRYIAIYDGTKKDFSEETELLYDELFHPKFTFITKPMKQDHHDKFDLHLRHGMKISREDLKGLHMMHLSEGTRISLIHFKAGLGCVDVKFNLKNIDEDRDIRVVYSVEDDKLVKGREVEDSFLSVTKAKWCSGSIFNAFHRFELPDKQVLTSLP